MLAVSVIAGCGAQSSNAPERPQEKRASKEVQKTSTREPTSTENSAPSNKDLAPDYKLDRIESEGEVGGYTKGKAVAYAVTGPDYLQAIAEEIYSDNSEYDILLVQFYSDTEERTDQLTGVRHVYRSPQAEQAFIQGAEESIDEVIKEQCENWTAEDRELLGPPPKEWNCEQG